METIKIDNQISNTLNYEHLRIYFQLKTLTSFEFYLESIFPDFCTFQEKNKPLGISKIRFIDWAKLPIYICEKLFYSFDRNNDGYLSLDDLRRPLSMLYFGSFEETAQVIFNLYDFDHDGKIFLDDVKTLLAFLPLKGNKTKIEYMYQLESLDELDEILKETFKNKQSLNFKEFQENIQLKSDIYLQIVCFLYQRCPFQEKTIKRAYKLNYFSYSQQNIKNFSLSLSPREKDIYNKTVIPYKKRSKSNVILRRPSETTRFSPVQEFFSSKQVPTIKLLLTDKSTFYKSDKFVDENNINNIAISKEIESEVLVPNIEKLALESKKEYKEDPTEKGDLTTITRKYDSFSDLISPEMSGFKGMVRFPNEQNPKSTETQKGSQKVNEPNLEKVTETTEILKDKQEFIEPEEEFHLKTDKRFSHPRPSLISDILNNKSLVLDAEKSDYNPIKMGSSKFIQQIATDSLQKTFIIEDAKNASTDEELKPETDDENEENSKIIIEPSLISELDISDPFREYQVQPKEVKPRIEKKSKTVKNKQNQKIYSIDSNILFQGAITRFVKALNKSFLIWMVLVGQDIYYFDSEFKKEYTKFHHLSGCFVKENGEAKINGEPYYSFSIIFSNKERKYYTKERNNAKDWTSQLRKSIGYQNFFDYYEMIDDLGQGHFGVVKLGVIIKTKQKIAIKVLNKKKMKDRELEQAQREIDILKKCKHPNIVSFIDHFENSEYIFIVMEYLMYGTVFDYLKAQKKLSEKICAKIIHQVAFGLKYMHDFCIIHRDIKPDNILIASIGDDIKVKIGDFGLSKILAPQEKTTEGYGTLTYVAPEIINRVPYNKSVDIWSLGVLTYFLVSGSLPFYDVYPDYKKTLAKKIVKEPLKFPDDKWKIKSTDVKNFIELCLDKDMNKRICIDQVLTHKSLNHK